MCKYWIKPYTLCHCYFCLPLIHNLLYKAIKYGITEEINLKSYSIFQFWVFRQHLPLNLFYFQLTPFKIVTTTTWTVIQCFHDWMMSPVFKKRHNVYLNRRRWPLWACVLASLGLSRWTIIYIGCPGIIRVNTVVLMQTKTAAVI